MLAGRKDEIFVTGATSIIGSLLVPMLTERGMTVRVLGRNPGAGETSESWHFIDLAERTLELPKIKVRALIHTASLWLLLGWLEKFHACGVRRVIAFSSTSRFTKHHQVPLSLKSSKNSSPPKTRLPQSASDWVSRGQFFVPRSFMVVPMVTAMWLILPG